jgi:hypothetical protein
MDIYAIALDTTYDPKVSTLDLVGRGCYIEMQEVW